MSILIQVVTPLSSFFLTSTYFANSYKQLKSASNLVIYTEMKSFSPIRIHIPSSIIFSSILSQRVLLSGVRGAWEEWEWVQQQREVFKIRTSGATSAGMILMASASQLFRLFQLFNVPVFIIYFTVQSLESLMCNWSFIPATRIPPVAGRRIQLQRSFFDFSVFVDFCFDLYTKLYDVT